MPQREHLVNVGGNAHLASPAAGRPASSAALKGVLHFATDTGVLTYHDGTNWIDGSHMFTGTLGATGLTTLLGGAIAPARINAQTGTTYTLVLDDQSKLITLANAAATTLTIPLNASVAFPVGTQIDLVQVGAGQVTVAQVNAAPAPTGVTATGSTTGGTLAAGTYFYKVTAIGANGESVGSNEVSVTTTGSTSSVSIVWTAAAGATSYRIYRGTASNGQSVFYTDPDALSPFVDTGAASTAGTVPAASGSPAVSAFQSKVKIAGQYASASLVKTAADAWLLLGTLA